MKKFDFDPHPSHPVDSEVVSMSVQIAPEIESQFDDVAERTGESKDVLIRKALLSYLEDRQDAERAAARLKHIGNRINLQEIGRKYGLVD